MLLYINLLFVYLFFFFTRDSLLVYLNGFSLFVVFGLVVVTLASSLCHVTPTTTLSLMYDLWFLGSVSDILRFASFKAFGFVSSTLEKLGMILNLIRSFVIEFVVIG